jgi:hypothetical protein
MKRRQARIGLGMRVSRWSLLALLACLGMCCTQQSHPQAIPPAPQSAQTAKRSPSTLVTSLTAPACIVLEVQTEGGNSIQRCPGILGYQLLVLDSDSRMSITVLDPEGRQWPLAYDQVITPYFSSLGPQAEWRVLQSDAGGPSMALAVKVNANEDPESQAVTIYWAVARISPSDVCVTDRIRSGPDDAQRIAAAMADANSHPCVSTM